MNRDKIGRFAEKFVTKVKKVLRRSALVCALGWIVFGSFQYGQFEKSRTLIAEAASIPLTGFDIKGKTLEQLKDEVITKLSNDENENPDAVPFKWDDNSKGTLPAKDKPSYGCMQYKNSTVQRHYKAIYGESLTNLEAVLLALDCEKAKALAKEAIFGKLDAIGEWSAASEHMKAKVEVIREMI